jgi:hypothetical protein
LSGNPHGDSHKADGHEPPARKPAAGKNRRKTSADIGRALRTVYDDTLREAVPDDFTDLLGKLS